MEIKESDLAKLIEIAQISREDTEDTAIIGACIRAISERLLFYKKGRINNPGTENTNRAVMLSCVRYLIQAEIREFFKDELSADLPDSFSERECLSVIFDNALFEVQKIFERVKQEKSLKAYYRRQRARVIKF